VVRERRLLEARIVLAPVVVGQRRDPLAGHGAGEQTGGHRRVDDHADVLALGEGQDLALDVGMDERVRGLQRLHRGDGLRAAQLGDVEVRDADVLHESFGLELGERRPALLEVLVGNRPVNLVEVDRVDAQARQARLDLTADRVALEAVHDPAAAAVEQRRLGEDVRSLRHSLKRAADDLLGMSEPVRGRGVDPVHAQLERPVDRGERLLVVLRAPGELPATAADGPRAEADAGDVQAGGAELRGLECRLLHVQCLSLRN
jgi:hypothetical protein